MLSRHVSREGSEVRCWMGRTIMVRTARNIAWLISSLNCSVPLNFVRATAPSTWFPHAVIVSSVLMIVYVSSVSYQKDCATGRKDYRKPCRSNQFTYFIQGEHEDSKHRLIALRHHIVVEFLECLAIRGDCFAEENLAPGVLAAGGHCNGGGGKMEDRVGTGFVVEGYEILEEAAS
jgi:hypothetical protein